MIRIYNPDMLSAAQSYFNTPSEVEAMSYDSLNHKMILDLKDGGTHTFTYDLKDYIDWFLEANR